MIWDFIGRRQGSFGQGSFGQGSCGFEVKKHFFCLFSPHKVSPDF